MKRIGLIILVAALACLTSCNKVKDIKVNSAEVEALSPYGKRGAFAGLAVEIDNPTIQIKLSEMEAVVKCSGKILGKVTVDPFTLKPRTVETYHLKTTMSLDESLTLFDLAVFLDKDVLDKCTVDITAKGKIKGGLSKTITRKDIPLKKLIEKYADKKK